MSPAEISFSSQELKFPVSGFDLWQWWINAQQCATAAAISVTEIGWLVQELSDVDRLALRLETFKERPIVLLKCPFSELENLWQKRVQQRTPIQYLIGTSPWRQFSLAVTPAVLIPRPETECLIDLAVMATEHSSQGEWFSDGKDGAAEHWADLGTGSGAIALGLATAFPAATIHAVDSSQAALAIARHNAATYHLERQIHFYHGDWLQPLTHLKRQLRGIVSNPPYIPTAMVADLQPEVVDHEPHLALDGGNDGLDAIRHLVAAASNYLKPGGTLLIEMMAGQAIEVLQLLEQQGSYNNLRIHPDLAGIERFAQATKGER